MVREDLGRSGRVWDDLGMCGRVQEGLGSRWVWKGLGSSGMVPSTPSLSPAVPRYSMCVSRSLVCRLWDMCETTQILNTKSVNSAP